MNPQGTHTDLCPLMEQYNGIFVLTDEQVARCCLPVLFPPHHGYPPVLAELPTLILPAGEQHKSIASVQRIWDFLLEHNATRSSLLINIGGGVICDMGGFAAATYMRGMAFVNIPTTLLAMVDAAAGGKTGIDYGGIKNSVGMFAEPVETIIDTRLLATLPAAELLSGYAEMLKHGILQGQEAFNELLAYDLRNVCSPAFGEMIKRSCAYKQSVVQQDPYDHDLRQVLNFGHTIGHAIEALCLNKCENGKCEKEKCLHGFCVLYGMVAEAYLSHALCGLPAEVVSTLSRFMLENYGAAPITCNDYDTLLQLMQHDKKNRQPGTIRCTLLRAVGQPVTGQSVPPALLREAIEYLCSL